MLILNESNIEQCTDNHGVINAVKEAVLMYESDDLASPNSRNLIQKTEIHNLGKLINNQIKIVDNELVVFKSVGMVLFDLIVAKYIYQHTKLKILELLLNFKIIIYIPKC